MDLDDARERIRGCLLAGAIGDALGAPIEFLSLRDIRARHGAAGITGYLPAYGREGGAVTDDTQMTLFTAEGVMRALVRYAHRGIIHPPSMLLRSYWRWLVTQGEEPELQPSGYDRGLLRSGWLVGVAGLHHRRAPGNTCLAALRSGAQGTMDRPINGSKGCGGVMRAAPIGFSHATDHFLLGAESAALTHGHPSGHLSAGVLASLVHLLSEGASLDEALDLASEALRRYPGHEETLQAIDIARALAARGRPTPEQLEQLGGGWVGEEALAISICCALVADDLLDGLLLAVNHSGDSDSTGSITGNLLGVVAGHRSLPATLLDGLELRAEITAVADDLADTHYGEGVGDEYEPVDDRVEHWMRRYPGI